MNWIKERLILILVSIFLVTFIIPETGAVADYLDWWTENDLFFRGGLIILIIIFWIIKKQRKNK